MSPRWRSAPADRTGPARVAFFAKSSRRRFWASRWNSSIGGVEATHHAMLGIASKTMVCLRARGRTPRAPKRRALLRHPGDAQSGKRRRPQRGIFTTPHDGGRMSEIGGLVSSRRNGRTGATAETRRRVSVFDRRLIPHAICAQFLRSHQRYGHAERSNRTIERVSGSGESSLLSAGCASSAGELSSSDGPDPGVYLLDW